MNKLFSLCVMAIAAALVSVASPTADAACLRWQTVCHYDCIEYYPNGTDCRKTKKRCERVCVEDSFDVDRGGIDDANRRVTPQSTHAPARKTASAEPDVIISGRLESSTIGGRRVWVIVPREAVRKAGKYRVYEVLPGKMALKSFENKLVDVTGTLAWTVKDKEGYLLKFEAVSVRESIK